MNAIITAIPTEVSAPFARHGSDVFVNDHSVPLSKLPASTFTIEVTPQGQLYFAQAQDLKAVTRLYGDIEKRADRVMNTFHSRSGNTGVLLSGEKGSGKTLLARLLSQQCRGLGMPTIMLTKALPGDALLALLKSVTQPYVLFIDEFEKLYAGGQNDKADRQSSLLTVFDGALATNRLTLVTCNDLWRISDYMRNRPGRFFYHFEYRGLGEEFIRDYCAENLKDQSHTDGVVALALMFNAFNFDMLQAIVEEMNRYGETASEVVRYLNVMPATEEVQWEVEKLEVPDAYLDEWVEEILAGNPGYKKVYEEMEKAGQQVNTQGYVTESSAPLDEQVNLQVFLRFGHRQVNYKGIEYHPDEITLFQNGKVHYQSEEHGELVLARKKSRRRNYFDL